MPKDTLTVTDENGCTVSQEILITGIGELANGFAVSVSPNPTLGLFSMNFSGLNGEKVSFRIMDTQGRLVTSREFSNATGERREVVDLTAVAAGVYYIQLNIGDALSTIKLIKE